MAIYACKWVDGWMHVWVWSWVPLIAAFHFSALIFIYSFCPEDFICNETVLTSSVIFLKLNQCSSFIP